MRVGISGLFVLIFLVNGCGNSHPKAPLVAPIASSPPEAPAPMTLIDMPKEERTMWEKILVNEKIKEPISAITLQSEPGMGNYEIIYYAITLQSDGTATYIADGLIKRKGTFQAHIPPSKFRKIARLIDECGFVHYKPGYGLGGTDGPSASISVAGKGTRKTVSDEAAPPRFDDNEAPKALQQIELQMNSIVPSVKWKKVSNKTDLPDYAPQLIMPKQEPTPVRRRLTPPRTGTLQGP